VTDPRAAESIRKFYAEVAISAESFARAVAFAMSQPEEVDVNEILFQPTRQEIQYRSRQTSLMSNPTKGTIWRRTEEVTRKGCLRNP
jgi:hypothetical protein